MAGRRERDLALENHLANVWRTCDPASNPRDFHRGGRRPGKAALLYWWRTGPPTHWEEGR